MECCQRWHFLFLAHSFWRAWPMVTCVADGDVVPDAIEVFLRESGLPEQTLQNSVRPFNMIDFLTDSTCSLSNGSQFSSLAQTFTFKTFQPEDLDEWKQLNEKRNELINTTIEDMKSTLDLTVYKPRTENDEKGPPHLLPVVVGVQGRTWYSGSVRDGMQCYLSTALSLGYAAVMGERRVGQQGWRGRHMVHDVKELIQWVVNSGKENGLDPSRIVVMGGGGSGAHLALTASYQLNEELQRRAVTVVIARHGATNLVDAWQTPQKRFWNEREAIENITGQALFGEGQETEEDAASAQAGYEYLSPVHHAAHNHGHIPPTVILHCRQDEYYNFDVHAATFADILSNNKVPHLLIDPFLHSHGCDVGSTAPFQLIHYVFTRVLISVKLDAFDLEVEGENESNRPTDGILEVQSSEKDAMEL